MSTLAPAASAGERVAAKRRRIDITITTKGFEPREVRVKRGEPVSLVFTRKTDQTCAKDVVVYLDGGHTIERKLPLDVPVRIDVTFPRAGELGYACSMSMHGGAIFVQ